MVTADGDTFRCRIAVVTTARFYGGPLAITRNTHASRPGIRLVALDDDRPATLARAAVALVLGRLDRMAGVIDREVAEVRLSGDGMRMQIDGDRMETVDAPIRADGGILQVITGR